MAHPMADAAADAVAETDVRRLRQQVAHHPVYRWASGPVDRTTLLVHQAFCRWASAVLARDLKIPGPERHLTEARRSLRRRGAGRPFEAFLDAVDAGRHPSWALKQSSALPPAAQPFVETVWAVGAGGSEAARLGALAFGLPCCIVDQALARDRLEALAAAPGHDAPLGIQAEAEAAAAKILAAQLDLYEGALHVIRRRHMASHPSMWRPAARETIATTRRL